MYTFLTRRDRIGMAVLQLLEDGFLLKLMKKWWYDKGECATEDGSVNVYKNVLNRLYI